MDTSALVAILKGEDGWEELGRALWSEEAFIPAPVVTELNLVTSKGGNEADPEVLPLLSRLLDQKSRIESYTLADAQLSAEAHRRYGRGSGRGGTLNLLDIMVYCMAKRLGRPILCTGRDFASTDAQVHPASRTY
ncbi:MAG: type II toxin-antitoxin system VapC family toxin [Allosphingosinicella sp.]